MNRLTEIANKYNTDKGTNSICANNGPGHGFTEFYYKFFKDIKKPTILELGVYEGASIKMFNEFYNGNCEIYCVDIDNKCDVSYIGDNIHFHILDLGNEKQLSNFLQMMNDNNVRFDIILDDASHIIYHQMIAYSFLRELLKKDGMYIIEDLHTCFGDIWPYNKNEKTTTLDFFVNFKPYHRFGKEMNEKLLSEIKTVELFSNDNNSGSTTLNGIRKNRSITAVIKLKDKNEQQMLRRNNNT